MDQPLRLQAENITLSYLDALYAFARKRTASLEDAEDLAQEIGLKLYKALLVRDDIRSVEKFVWAVAHHTLANYYRDRLYVGDIDLFREILADASLNPQEQAEKRDAENRLRRRIAYLSQHQRQVILLHYYRGCTVSQIAHQLSMPEGTVKWHLSAARTELKKGMNTMRNLQELAFQPIRLAICGLSGSVGSMGGPDHFLRSALSQNIAYTVYRRALTIKEIADILSVSPVYVESEAAFLEEYGLLIKEKDRYRTNFLIDESTPELTALHDALYEKGAALMADKLYDNLSSNSILTEKGLDYPAGDRNFLLWALIPYILSQSGESLMDQRISFEQGTTLRKDGGQNIFYTSVYDPSLPSPRYSEEMGQWFGPCWNGTESHILWSIDSPWSGKRIHPDTHQLTVGRDLHLLERFTAGESLHAEDLAYMVQKGYVSRRDNGSFTLSIVHIRNRDILQRLLMIGDNVKAACFPQIRPHLDAYVQAVLEVTPAHLHTMRSYSLQFLFYADAWFLLHSIEHLLASGKLLPPTPDQRLSLTTLFLPNNQL